MLAHNAHIFCSDPSNVMKTCNGRMIFYGWTLNCIV